MSSSTITNSTVSTYVSPTSTIPSSLHPIIQNVVSTFQMSAPISLPILASQARNCEYRPTRFAAAILRIRSPATTALIFSNGKVVVTGAKSPPDAHLAARKYVRICQKLGFRDVKFENFRIVNMVAVGAALEQVPKGKRSEVRRVREFLRLEGFAFKHAAFANYTPEIFSGCVYKMMKPKTCLLIFPNGKIVFTGATSMEDVEEAYRLIVPELLNFRTKNPGEE